MPTGYTARVYEGDTSLKNYILGCARAFGALAFMRDEPLDAPIPKSIPDNDDAYYQEEYEKACKRFDELRAMTDEEIHKEADSSYEEQRAMWKRSIERIEKENARYDAMLEKVRAWDCSINPDLAPVKGFAIEQLLKSREDISWVKKHFDEIKRQSDEEWYRQQIEICSRDISHYKSKLLKEKKRREEANQWLADLYASLEGID